MRVLIGDWPPEIPRDLLGLTYTRHWRLLSSLSVPSHGRISRQLGGLSREGREAIRRPHPELVEVLDPRATSLLAAELLRTLGPTSMLIAETLAAAVHHRSEFFVGDPQNAAGKMSEDALALGVEVIIVAPPS